MTSTTFIEIEKNSLTKSSQKDSKKDWGQLVIKKLLHLLQHLSPKLTAKIIWHFFTMPGKVRYSERQLTVMEQATSNQTSYKGHLIKSYTWGISGPRILLCHGWGSKAADFGKMIATYVETGYIVESIDMKAHGNSSGKQTALPEFRDIIKNHISKNEPFHAIIGHSLGGLAAGIALSELSKSLHPKHLFILSSPTYVRYFFKDLISELGSTNAVYHALCKMVKANYHQPIDYFDMRQVITQLSKIDTHLVYSEDDYVVPFEKGSDLHRQWNQSSFVQVKGLSHHKIISNSSIISYITNSINAI